MCIRTILKIRKNRPNWAVFIWLRGMDLNQRPPGYEPDELPTALPRDVVFRRAKSTIAYVVWKVNPSRKDIQSQALTRLRFKATRNKLHVSVAKLRGICNNIENISLYPTARSLLHFLFTATFIKEGYQSARLAVRQCGDLP